MNRKLKSAARLSLFMGVLTFINLGAMVAASGGLVRPATFPNEPGFTQAVFWLEMADSGREIELALGDPASAAGRRIRTAMDAMHRADFIFMICYTAFTASLFLLLARLGERTGVGIPRQVLYAGFALCAAALMGDIFETVKLIGFTSHPAPSQIGDGIVPLQIWTRVKSGALSAAGIILAYHYGRHFRWLFPGVLIPAVFGLSAVAGLVAISVHQYRFLMEHAGSLGMLAWLAALVHAGIVFFFKEKAS
ncbi:MAG: hypothetical protein KBA61_11430 [Spirochaetes bacterium]|nr:hypothetical protein [Spirochaetota bacterium]